MSAGGVLTVVIVFTASTWRRFPSARLCIASSGCPFGSYSVRRNSANFLYAGKTSLLTAFVISSVRRFLSASENSAGNFPGGFEERVRRDDAVALAGQLFEHELGRHQSVFFALAHHLGGLFQHARDLL